MSAKGISAAGQAVATDCAPYTTDGHDVTIRQTDVTVIVILVLLTVLLLLDTLLVALPPTVLQNYWYSRHPYGWHS